MNAVLTKIYQKRANQIARKAGFGNATEIVLGDEDRVIERRRPGYYMGERFVSSGVKHWAFKNGLEYKPAITVVMIRKKETR